MGSKLFYILILFLPLSSCDKEVNYSNTYIGMYHIWDKECPYPYILDNKNNNLYIIDNKGISIDSASWSKDSISINDTIQFINHTLYFPSRKDEKYSVYDLKDSIRFIKYKKGLNYKFGAYYKRLLQIPSFDINYVKEILKRNSWNYEHENKIPNRDLVIKYTALFDEQKMTQITSYFYNESKVYQETKTINYHLFEVNSLMFLSFLAEENDEYPIFHITKITEENVEWTNYSHREIQIEKLTKLDKSKDQIYATIEQIPPFELCLNNFQGSYYFGEDVTYDYGNDYLVNIIAKNAPKANQEGYINVHFFINCDGNIGQLGLEQMNKEFKPIRFNKELVSHIIKEVVQLKEWPSTISSVYSTKYMDVHAFLMFKIQGGKIVDLCP